MDDGLRSAPVRCSGGFTLVEIFLVILLIGVLTGISVPLFKKSTEDFQLKSAAFNLYKILQLARESALTRGQPTRLDLGFEEGTYRLTPSEGRFGKTMHVPEGLSLSGKEEQISCYPDGRCDVASVKLLGADGGYEIAVEDWGGSVRIREVPS